jgi:hypothetical protein
MDQAANAGGVTHMFHLVCKVAANKEVTGKKRFNQFYNSSPGRTFNFQARIKYLETKSAAQVTGSNVLVLRLSPGAIPRGLTESNCSKLVH